jgi:chitinase
MNWKNSVLVLICSFFAIVKCIAAPPVTVSNNKSAVLAPVMVGYYQTWDIVPMSESTDNGYNLIVVAFGTIDESTVSMTNEQEMPEFKEDVKAAQNLGAKVILSFGGANNTFKPGSVSAEALAKNIVVYLQVQGLNGIDFDLENITQDDFPGTTEQREDYISTLIKDIQQEDPALLVTSAPQINAMSDNKIALVNTSTETIYNKAISENLFNYIFVQAYNTPSFYIAEDGSCNADWNSDGGVNEHNPKFIGNIFPCLKALLPEASPTQIVIGQPANYSDTAGNGALVEGSYADIANEYENLQKMGDPNFGGAMVWSINEDAKTTDNKGSRKPYEYVSTILPSLS